MAQLCLMAAFTASTNAQTISPDIISCEDPEYKFNAMEFTCEKCEEGKVSDDAYGGQGLECVCKPGYKNTFDENLVLGMSGFGIVTGCEQCASGSAPTQDKSACLPCDSTMTKDSPSAGQCSCPAESIYSDTTGDGAARTSLTCVACETGQFPGAGWECAVCEDYAKDYNLVSGTDYKCQCRNLDATDGYSIAGDSCVATTDLTDLGDQVRSGEIGYAEQLQYYSLVDKNGDSKEKPDPFKSQIYVDWFVRASIGCWKDQSPQMCQVLANLCVLSLYDQQNSACDFLNKVPSFADANDIATSDPWREAVPYIEFPSTESTTPTSLLRQTIPQTDFKLKTTFVSGADQSSSKYLKYMLGRFTFDGEFIGYTELNSELSLCPMTYEDVLSMRQFGTQIESKCEISLDLISAQDSAAPEDQNIFYELYVQDSESNLLEVPVLVRNYRYFNRKTPNEGFDPVDTWVLVRRFFMIETLTGFVEGQSSKAAKYVRFAKDIRLKIMMDPDVPEQIYRPLLIVEYVEVDASALSPGAKFEVFFGVNYFSDYSKFMASTNVAFWLILILSLLVTAIRFYAYTRRNPGSKFGYKIWPAKLVEYFFDYFSEYMFWLIFLACANIFISFKSGMQATKLLPEEGQASQDVQGPFYALFGTVVVMKTIAVALKIFNQSKMDVFLVDLEQPNRITKSVVAWRHYFVANEFAELQAEERYISPEVTLIWFVFLWVGLGWQHVIKAEPDYSVVPDETKVTNILLELFFAGSLFFIIGFVQLVQHRIQAISSSGSAVTGFVDLCTLANVSLLMFDEQAHGYYLHAQAPWRSSDIPLVDLSRELQNEEKGQMISGGRGLKEHNQEKGQQPVQSFQIYAPKELRDELEDVRNDERAPPEEDESRSKKIKIKKTPAQEARALAKKIENKGRETDEEGDQEQDKKDNQKQQQNNEKYMKIRKEEYKKTTFNKILKSKLGDHILKEQICEQSRANNLFRTPPRLPQGKNSVADLTDLIVVPDADEAYPNFDSLLYCSLDTELLKLYVMYFIVFEIMVKANSLLSLFLVYIIERLFRKFRTDKGVQNMCEKTYIDENFLS